LVPENIRYQWIDLVTGRPSKEACFSAAEIPFIKGSNPQGSKSCSSPH